jgi:hypothetical protein
MPVLTKIAMKIAAQHPKREDLATWEEMIERFLFDRVYLSTSHVPGRDHEFPLPVEANATNSPFAWMNEAAMSTG